MGANQNVAVVWNITDPEHPVEQCRLRHKSAVKAILFCPWLPALLATGGGTNDRRICFWHTTSGRLLGETPTGRQVTALRWCTTRRELVATFGYLAADTQVLVAVYSYPGMNVLRSVKVKSPLRTLSASVSLDETHIAVVANDGTIRVYKLWEPRTISLVGPSSRAGSFGSAIIEGTEGIDVATGPVR